MEPRNGTPGTLVSPMSPTKPFDADSADPGEVNQIKQEQFEAQSGKYGHTPAEPHKGAGATGDSTRKTTWIEVVLVDESDRPVAGECYKVTLPDGTIASGTLDDNGFVRIDSIDPGGMCKINFPNLDQEAWVRA